MTPNSLSPEMTIRDAIARFPGTRAVFTRHRLDLCCGGAHTIIVAALARGLDPDLVMAEVRQAAGLA